MSSPGDVTLWIRRAQDGDREAARLLWDRYFRRLVGLARSRLRGLPPAAADSQLVAVGAFDSFYRGVEAGRFRKLEDRDDVWKVLMMITARKAADLAQHERRAKRHCGRVEGHIGPAGEGAAVPEPAGRERDPPLAAELDEEWQRLLGLLGDEELKAVAVLKLDGHTNREVAGLLGFSVSTAEIRVRVIRKIWEKEAPP